MDVYCEGSDQDNQVTTHKVEPWKQRPPNYGETEEREHIAPNANIYGDANRSLIISSQKSSLSSSQPIISRAYVGYRHDLEPFDQIQRHSFGSNSDKDETKQLGCCHPSNGRSPIVLKPLDPPITKPCSSLLRWWYLEILATATALASLAAMIGVLYTYDLRCMA